MGFYSCNIPRLHSATRTSNLRINISTNLTTTLINPSEKMPSIDVMDSAPSNAATQKSENQKSVKVLDELLNQLTISKTADETSAATSNIAIFINGDIEEHDAPTK